jgi:hypothetical protein
MAWLSHTKAAKGSAATVGFQLLQNKVADPEANPAI